MQKKIIALAVAGLVSGAAFAQSNVTIYGVADAGFVNSSGDRNGNVNKGNANFSGIQSGILAGSRIGFKGEEGLGNGLKAVFTLEYNLNIDDNSGIGSGNTYAGPSTAALGAATNTIATGLQARQQFVGLNHAKLGTVALGRQYNPGYGASARNDAMVSSAAASSTEVLRAASGTRIAAATSARVNNAVTYTSPNWSGFTASAIYGYGETGNNAAGTVGVSSATAAGNGVGQGSDGQFGAGLNYANGPLNIDVLYVTLQNRSTAGPTVAARPVGVAGANAASATAAQSRDSVNEWMLAGTYDFKIVKLYASYQDLNDKNGTSAMDMSNKLWNIGATMPVFANGTVRAMYSDLSWDRTGAGDSKSWSLGYTHAMSKRTTLYTTYTHTDNDKNALVAAGSVASTRSLGESSATITAGLNHTF
jgi:predicted porin